MPKPITQSEIQRLIVLRDAFQKADDIAKSAKKSLEQCEKDLKIRLAGQAPVEEGALTVRLLLEPYQSIDWRRELEKRLGSNMSALIVELTPKKQKIVVNVSENEAWEAIQPRLQLEDVGVEAANA